MKKLNLKILAAALVPALFYLTKNCNKIMKKSSSKILTAALLPVLLLGLLSAQNAPASIGESFAVNINNCSITKDGLIVNIGDVYFRMVDVQGGTFTMGCTYEQKGNGLYSCYGNTQDTHKVKLSKSYYIGETEVTQKLWLTVMGSFPKGQDKGSGDDYPVYYVTWDDIVGAFDSYTVYGSYTVNGITYYENGFCYKLSELVNGGTVPADPRKCFRLPTEAEWEYAARGGNKSRNTVFSGSNTLDSVAWCMHNSSNETHQVKTKRPNELGIYDLSGNVCEWCSDCYYNYYYDNSPFVDPVCLFCSNLYRVRRGGGWNDDDLDSRVYKRGSDTYSRRYDYIGFRVVRSAL
jgi:formylglycine-generating enzyme required for sulfatase activity